MTYVNFISLIELPIRGIICAVINVPTNMLNCFRLDKY